MRSANRLPSIVPVRYTRLHALIAARKARFRSFSTAASVRRRLTPPAPGATEQLTRASEELTNDAMSGLFEAVVEATEESIYNSLFMATPVTARGRTVEAIPLDRVREILKKYNVGSR